MTQMRHGYGYIQLHIIQRTVVGLSSIQLHLVYDVGRYGNKSVRVRSRGLPIRPMMRVQDISNITMSSKLKNSL